MRQTEIRYALTASSRVKVAVVSSDGRTVARLLDEQQVAGKHSLSWNGSDASGRAVRAGVYYYVVMAGSRMEKGVVVKE